MRWIVVWALVWTLAGGALAAPRARAQAPAVDMSVNQVTDSTYPDVGVVLSVVDAAGVPVRGLTADQFSASDDDGPLAVASVQSAQDASLPLNVVVAIDISGSMVGEPLARAKDAANQFVRNLGPQDQAAIFTFNATVTPVTPFTNDRVRLTNAIASLNAGGGTALYEAVQTAAFAARSAPSTRRAIVLLTDGENADAPLSTATKDGSINAATGAGVPIFTVGFGAVADVTYLQFLAQATQAQFRAADTANVATVYGDIAALLRSQYVVRLTASKPADGASSGLFLRVQTPAGTASTSSTFRRGSAPVAAPTLPPATPRPAPTPAKPGGGGTSAVPLIVFSTAVGLLLLGAAAFFLLRWRRRRAVLRHQLETVAPNPRLSAAQPLPRAAGVRASTDGVTGSGRLVSLGGEDDGRSFPLGGGAIIGSSRRHATILLAPGADVAPEHARIFLRDGRYLLHHAGGRSRRTLVGGKDADWVTLEPGDELAFGAHRFRFEL